MIDSAWYEAPFTFQPIPHMLRFYKIEGDWRPDTEYSLEIDSAAFEDIYGLVSQSYKRGMKVKSLDEYSTLTIKVSGVADSLPLRVRLLNKNDGVVKEVLASTTSVPLLMLMIMVSGTLATMMRIVRQSRSITIPVRLNVRRNGMLHSSGISRLCLVISRSHTPSPNRRPMARRN